MESNEFNPTPENSGGRKKIWLLVILLIFILGIMALFIFNKDKDVEEVSTDTPTSDNGPSLVEDSKVISEEENPETEKVDDSTAPKIGETVKKNEESLLVSSLKEDENIISEPKSYLEGDNVSEDEIPPGIFSASESEISDFFKKAEKINIGYDLNSYNFELLDATDTHLLFLANPRVLILYDIQLKKIYEISNNTDGGSFSDDGKYVVYYRNGFFSSYGEVFDIANKRMSIVKELKGTTFSDVKMSQGYIYFIYYDDDTAFKTNLTTYAFTQGNYSIDKTTTDDLYNVGPKMYQSSDKNIYLYTHNNEGITQFSANKTYNLFSDFPGAMPDETYIVEDNTIFSSQLRTLYINSYPTEFTSINGMTYVDGKLYFFNDNYFYSWDGNQYEEIKIFDYIQTIKSGNHSLYLRSSDGVLYRIQTN